MPVALSVETIRDVPKVLLHDHLDGGLRARTVIELADAACYPDVPTDDPEELAAWFLGAAHSGSLVRYLETFGHTVGVLQTADALVRVASECAQDLAADGVVYAEVRYAPEQHTNAGLTLDEVVAATLEGFRAGERAAAAAGRRCRVARRVVHRVRRLRLAGPLPRDLRPHRGGHADRPGDRPGRP